MNLSRLLASLRKPRPAKKYPHEGVYIRLMCSDIHGVGVFAIRPIPAGTEIFEGDQCPTTKVPARVVESQPEEIQRLYKDFCALERGQYYSPTSFNNMNVAYFLNESRDANIRTDDGHRFFALRDIKPGEELTVDYSTFSE